METWRLLVGRASEVWAYTAERLDLPTRRATARTFPNRLEAQKQLALSLADAGLWDEAAAAIELAEPLVNSDRYKAEWHSDRLEWAVRRGAVEEYQKFATQKGLPFDWQARLQMRHTARHNVRHLSLIGLSGFPLRPNDNNRELSSLENRIVPPPDELKVHNLPAGSVVQSSTTFPSYQTIPLLPFHGDGLPGLQKGDGKSNSLLVTDGETISAYRPGSEKPSWTLKLPQGLKVFQAGEVGESIVAAGPRGLLKFRLSDGRQQWANLWAEVDPLTPGRVSQLRSTSGYAQLQFSRFVLTQTRLIALVEPHLLMGFDLADGGIAWVMNTLGQPRYTPWTYDGAPKFTREFFADDDFVIAQTDTGERWVLRAMDGKLHERAESALVPWSGPPLQLLNGLYAVPSGGESVEALSLNYRANDAAKIDWENELGRPTSSTGKPPELIGLQDSLILGVQRNHGFELERIDGKTGLRLWGKYPPLLTGERYQLNAASHDNSALYITSDNQLEAIQLESGSRLWKSNLSHSTTVQWQTKPGLQSVIAFPRQPVPSESAVSRIKGWQDCWPQSVWRLPSLPWIVYDACSTHTLTLYWVNPKTGQVQHRLELSVGPLVGVHLGPTVSVVATAGKAYWLSK
jgi:hypothetical protein